MNTEFYGNLTQGAKNIAALIAQSDSARALYEADQRARNDAEVQDILKRLQDSQQRLQTSKLDEARQLAQQDLASAQADLKNNKLTSSVLQLQFEVNQFVDLVVKTIHRELDYQQSKTLGTEEKISASHILVATEEEANDILQQLDAGQAFEALAKQKSSCPSKATFGSLGYFPKGAMVPEFDEAAWNLAVGETTKAPVKTRFGYHIIRRDS